MFKIACVNCIGPATMSTEFVGEDSTSSSIVTAFASISTTFVISSVLVWVHKTPSRTNVLISVDSKDFHISQGIEHLQMRKLCSVFLIRLGCFACAGYSIILVLDIYLSC